MKIFTLNRQISVLCGICSPSDEGGDGAQFRQLLMIVFFVVNLILVEISDVMYALYNLEQANIAEFLFGCLQASSVFSVLLTYISMVYQRQYMRNLFDELQSLFDQCKYCGKKAVPINPFHNVQFFQQIKIHCQLDFI